MTTDPAGTGAPPAFTTDPGASRAFRVALLVLLLVCGWMASGFIFPSEEAEPAAVAEPAPPLVRVRLSQAEPVTLNFRAEGQALPDRDTSVRAEATGTVVEVMTRKGAQIEGGAPIARLSADEAEATLEQAREELARARREFDNASALQDRGVATSDRVSAARATLAAAQAQVAAATRALEDLTITAPFAGRIEALPVNEGEFLSAGEEAARVVDNDPLTVAIQVPQQALNRIAVGQPAQVAFITGQTRDGEVSFVGTAAADATRTFLAEITIANPDGAIPAGISAAITIPTGQETAHFIEPSIVSLDPDGNLGVKTEENGKVRFVPVEVASAELGGVWVTGLPERARIITIGQGFVRDGEAVRVQSGEDDEAGDDAKATTAGGNGGSTGADGGDVSALTETAEAGP